MGPYVNAPIPSAVGVGGDSPLTFGVGILATKPPIPAILFEFALCVPDAFIHAESLPQMGYKLTQIVTLSVLAVLSTPRDGKPTLE